MEVLTFDEKSNLAHFGRCKIVINMITKDLIVKSSEENPTIIVQVCFNENYILINKMLFVVCSNENNKISAFILIFSGEESCKKVFDAVQKGKSSAPPKINNCELDDLLETKFFLPLLAAPIEKNNSFEANQIFIIMLNKFPNDRKKKCLSILKNSSENLYLDIAKELGGLMIDDIDNPSKSIKKTSRKREAIMDANNEESGLKMVETVLSLRKRRRNEANSEPENDENYQSDESDVSYSDFYEDVDEEELENESETVENCRQPKRFKNDSESEIIEAPNFKLISYDENGRLKKKLLIFPIEDKTMCYVYGCSNTENRYVCWRCKIRRCKNSKEGYLSAIVFKDNQKEEYVKLNTAQHICSLIKYEPEKYTFDAIKQIVHEPNFKIFNYEEFGVLKSRLIIFPSDNQEFCYEYTGSKGKYFRCNRCFSERLVCATFYKKQEENGQDYVKLSKTKHVCEMIEFNPEKYEFGESKYIVKAPNFKIDSYQQSGVNKKKLFIFTSLEKKMGYDYHFIKSLNKFCCCGCQSKKLCLSARICQDADGNYYVKISKAKHICDVQTYGTCNGINYNVFYKPDYQIIEKTIYGKTSKKLFVSLQENKDLCYEFTYVQCTKNFKCNYCYKEANNFNNIKAFLCYDDDGNEFIRVHDRPHLCQPLPYPINYNENEKIIRARNYQFVKRKHFGKLAEKLIIFANEEKTLCYEYMNRGNDYWICCPCKSATQKTISAKLFKGKEEYIELDKHEHACEPIKFDPEDAKINIVKNPNFKLENGRNKLNRETIRLTIFDPNNSDKCFYYCCVKGDNLFQCSKCCLKKHYVYAKIIRPQNDEAYVVLSETKHICQKEIYEPLIQNLKIIKHPNFYLENIKTCKEGNERLMIKNWNNDNDLWYSYLWDRTKKSFYCCKCKKLGKAVTAKLYKADNTDDDYIELSAILHLCDPQPFVRGIELEKAIFSMVKKINKNYLKKK